MTTNVWYKNPILLVFVIGLPVLVVVCCVFFVFFAVHVQDSTVRDDWYMDGKALHQDASLDVNANTIGAGGVMHFLQDKTVFELKFLQDVAYPDALYVSVSHATDKSKDFDFIMQHVQAGEYAAAVMMPPIAAKYYVQIKPAPLQHSDDASHAYNHASWRLIQSVRLPAKHIAFAPLAAFKD